MIRMPIGSGASRPHRAARDCRNGARNASDRCPRSLGLRTITSLPGSKLGRARLRRGFFGQNTFGQNTKSIRA